MNQLGFLLLPKLPIESLSILWKIYDFVLPKNIQTSIISISFIANYVPNASQSIPRICTLAHIDLRPRSCFRFQRSRKTRIFDKYWLPYRRTNGSVEHQWHTVLLGFAIVSRRILKKDVCISTLNDKYSTCRLLLKIQPDSVGQQL